MRFVNKTNKVRVGDAIVFAENLLQFEHPMMNEILYKNDWKFNGINGVHVYSALRLRRDPISIFTYRPFNPFTAAIGYFDGKAIHINIRKLPNLSINDLTGLLLHEYAHYCGFTHGNNYKTEEKCLYSVPYYLSENVSRWLESEDIWHEKALFV